MVGAPDQASFGGAAVVGGKLGVLVCRAFGGFDDDKTGAVGFGGVEVDVGLVVGDVEAFNAVRTLHHWRGCGRAGGNEESSEIHCDGI